MTTNVDIVDSLASTMWHASELRQKQGVSFLSRSCDICSSFGALIYLGLQKKMLGVVKFYLRVLVQLDVINSFHILMIILMIYARLSVM